MIVKYFKDPISGLTHFIATIAAIIGLVLLISAAVNKANTLNLVAYTVYGTTLIMMFTASTIYHWFGIEGKYKNILRKIDHIMIFFFIAGTYTPYCLVTLQGNWGWSLFSIAWGITALGLLIKIFWLQAPRWLTVSIYLIMGWLCIIAIYPLTQKLSIFGFSFLVLGGLAYSLGAMIYLFKKPNPFKLFGFHEIWHIFVILGSTFHYLSIWSTIR